MKAYRGVDVSYAQGTVDWERVAASGVQFAMLRMWGRYGQDTAFVRNWTAAKKAGVQVGGFFFSYAVSAEEARAEAKEAKALMNRCPLPLGIFYDFEYDTEDKAEARGVTFTKALRAEVIRAFCDEIPGAGVYVNGDYLVSRLEKNALKGYPLWLASWPLPYAKNFSKNPSAAPMKWGAPVIWQFSCKGAVDGINGEVDLDYGYWSSFPAIKPSAPGAPSVPAASTLKKGDAVCVSVYTKSGLRKKAQTYDGKTWVVYLKQYEVMQVSGDRVVIGSKGVVTAAVNAKILKKLP